MSPVRGERERERGIRKSIPTLANYNPLNELNSKMPVHTHTHSSDDVMVYEAVERPKDLTAICHILDTVSPLMRKKENGYCL